jgi:hypothetical protein
MALSGLLTAVAPWRATPEASAMFKLLQPLGDIERFRFEDWRNTAVRLEGADCASAVYSRPGESFIILGSFNAEPTTVTCRIRPDALSSPLPAIASAELVAGAPSVRLDGARLAGDGEKITIPGDGAVVIRIK